MSRARNKRPNFLMTDDDQVPAEMLEPGPKPDHEDPDEPEPGDPDPEDDEDPQDPEDEDNSGVPTGPGAGHTPADLPPAACDLLADRDLPRSGELVPPGPLGVHHYEARITIVDAWQYPGNLVKAPEWIDRNWAAYADHDPVREIEPGPALRVPLPSGVNAMVRIGDYVARQEVRVTKELSDIRLEVWPAEQFEKLFMPVQVEPKELHPIAA